MIDPVVQRKMVDEVYALASASSAASQTLTDWYQQNSPFARLQKGNGGHIGRVDRPAIFEEL